VAPGVDVRTTDLSYGGQWSYTTVSGSSLAAPHVAGVVALLAGAFPSASVGEIEAAVTRSARDLGALGEDDLYGHGLVDALAAFKSLRASLDSGGADAFVSNPSAPSRQHASQSGDSKHLVPESQAGSSSTWSK
jgi:subtilisin family serine protease